MKRQVTSVMLVVLLSAGFVFACSWAPGNFHKVTALQGTVVGRNFKSLGRAHNFFWWRPSPVAQADLILYEYRSPDDIRDGKLEREITRTKTTDTGKFDFGKIALGHYTLRLSAGRLQDSFDVEIVDSAVKNDNVVIDISPVSPDCTGGHEFKVRNKS